MPERDVPTVSRCMQPVRVRLHPDDDLLDAIDLLVEYAVAAVAVVDEGDHLLGVITEKDCLRAVASAAYDNVKGTGRVGDYMSSVPRALTPDTDMLQAIDIFLAGNFPLLPVVSDGRLIGRVRRLDLLMAVQDLLAAEGVARKRESEDAKLRDRPRSIEAMQRSAARLGRDVLAEVFSRLR